MPARPRVIIVGGGLAGLSATIKIIEHGTPVQLFSIVPVRRSHSVCAQGGINAAINQKGENDSPAKHFDETIFGGDFLANQQPVKDMCEAAPNIIFLLDRMGVPFNRTPEGNLDFRRFGGTKYSRTAFAGATTGQQLLYALDEQVRRGEDDGLVQKFEGWEFVSVVRDDAGACKGIVAQNRTSMEFRAFPADAVILATGGCGLIFGKSTNSLVNTGTAAGAAYQQGAIYANGEFIQVHPTAMAGYDKLRLMSESIRGEGGRVWTYRDGAPWYFLEDWYPAYGNLVPRDIATRAIFKVCVELGLGVDGQNLVFLDVSHLPAEMLETKLGGVLDIYEKFSGLDPKRVPMKVFPAVHYSMGGLWVGYDQMTNIPGLFACGEVDYQYHGANRLGANSLLSCIHGGFVTGPNAVEYARGLRTAADDLPEQLFRGEMELRREQAAALERQRGDENPYVLHRELGEWMTNNVTVIRYNDKLRQTAAKIKELMERYRHIQLPDDHTVANQSLFFTRALWNMLELAQVITLGALRRDESRGAHYKPEFPDRNDAEWLKTTLARWTPDGPAFSYEPVDLSYIPPRPRRYDIDSTAGAKVKAAASTSADPAQVGNQPAQPVAQPARATATRP